MAALSLALEEDQVHSQEAVRTALGAAASGGGPGLTTADRLCNACVELLEVDGAAISVTYEGATQGTFGSSGELSRRLDEFQFTFGEGPCLESVRMARPVLVTDFRDPREHRWPAYSEAVLDAGVRAVYALPVAIASVHVGALDLFCNTPGKLSNTRLTNGLLAAELAALPLLDLMTAELEWATAGDGGDGWSQLASLERVEVYQATGMVMAQLGVGAADALVRLRAHGFANGMTASQVAWSIVERHLSLESDDSWHRSGPRTGPSS